MNPSDLVTVVADELEDGALMGLSAQVDRLSEMYDALSCQSLADADLMVCGNELSAWQQAVCSEVEARPVVNTSGGQAVDFMVWLEDRYSDLAAQLSLAINWDESKHPRAEDGKFTDGSGAVGAGSNSAKMAGLMARPSMRIQRSKLNDSLAQKWLNNYASRVTDTITKAEIGRLRKDISRTLKTMDGANARQGNALYSKAAFAAFRELDRFVAKSVAPATKPKSPKSRKRKNSANDFVVVLVNEGDWDESKHPRAEDGKWTDGSGSGHSWEDASKVEKAGKGTVRYTDKSGNILGAVQHTGGKNQPWWATDHEAEPISKHKTAREAKAAVEAFVKKLKARG